MAAGWWIEREESYLETRSDGSSGDWLFISSWLLRLVTGSSIDTHREKIDCRNVNKRLIKWEERWYACCGFTRNNFIDRAVCNTNRLWLRKRLFRNYSDIRTILCVTFSIQLMLYYFFSNIFSWLHEVWILIRNKPKRVHSKAIKISIFKHRVKQKERNYISLRKFRY